MNRYKLQEPKIPINRWPTPGQTWANRDNPMLRVKLLSKRGSFDDREDKEKVVWNVGDVKWDHPYITEENLMMNWIQVYEQIQVQSS